MAVLGGIHTSSLESLLLRGQLAAARQQAAQAQAKVQTLRDQLDSAIANNEQRQTTVRTLSDKTQQSDPTYQTQVQSSQPSSATSRTQTLLTGAFRSSSLLREASQYGHLSVTPQLSLYG